MLYYEVARGGCRKKDPRKYFRRVGRVHQGGKDSFTIKAPKRAERRIRRICRRRGLTFVRSYEERLGRSTDYRRKYLSAAKRPLLGYRCRYCNRRLSDENVTVDHVIPVYKAKTGNARAAMRLLGIKDINDTKNLVVSCATCNQKKGTDTGIWILKAVLGKHKLYWITRKAITIGGMAVIVLAICELTGFHAPLQYVKTGIAAAAVWVGRAFAQVHIFTRLLLRV